MLYLTFNDAPSGVYFSQVTDVCRFISDKLDTPVKLVAFISIRDFRKNRKLIRLNYPDSIIFPMFPKHKNWRLNIPFLFLLLLFLKEKAAIARGPFAFEMILKMKKVGLVKKICFDGRGAYSCELNEYEVVRELDLKEEVKELERSAVIKADFRISVSTKLIKYWNDWYGYSGNNHTVIPCTLNTRHLNRIPDESEMAANRKKLGFEESDIILVYSGSDAGWQSFQLFDQFLIKVLEDNVNVKVLFLSGIDLNSLSSMKVYPDRISKMWVKPSEVIPILSSCDYGILIREKSVTNEVASPTKFAEYLIAGLSVLISEDLGDFSSFVVDNSCGIVIHDLKKSICLEKVSIEKKKLNCELATSNFSKDTYIPHYAAVIDALRIC